MHVHHAKHRIAVLREARERPLRAGHLRAGRVRTTAHDRCQRGGDCAPLVAVVRDAEQHQEAAEVGVAEAERAKVMAIFRDVLGRVAREVDEDLLRHQEQPARVPVAVDVEREVAVRIVAEKLREVDAREVAGRIVQEHVLGARIRRVDPIRVRARVPAVDRRVVLHARVGAPPSRDRELTPEILRVVGVADLAGRAHHRLPLAAALDRAHEVVRHADGVVRVLPADRVVRVAVEVGREPGRDERVRFLLFAHLPVDEVDDLRVIHVEAHHLRGAARGAAALRRAGSAIEHLEKRHEAARRTAARQLLLFAANCAEVRPRP